MDALSEIKAITERIEKDTATLDDYTRYESLLLKGGLSHEMIYSSLNKAGFNTWDEFLKARKRKERDRWEESNLIGALIGLGLGLLLYKLIKDKD